MGASVYQPGVWYNVSQGKFAHKREDGTREEFDRYEGVVTSIKKKNGDYQGEPKVDIILGMSDGVENASISFNAESPYARGFFARITECNIDEPIMLCVMGWNDDGKRDKAVSLCFMYQGATKIEPRTDVPNSEKVKVGTKTISDWSAMNAWTDEVVAELQSKITQRKTLPMPDMGPSPRLAAASAEVQNDYEPASAPIDDLPF